MDLTPGFPTLITEFDAPLGMGASLCRIAAKAGH